jgi:hypothetical protein
MVQSHSPSARSSSLRDPNSPRAKARAAMHSKADSPQISEEEFRQQLRAAEAIGKIKRKHKTKEHRGPWGLLKRIFCFGGLVKFAAAAAIGGYFLANPEVYETLMQKAMSHSMMSAFDGLPDLAQKLKL